MNKSSTTQAQGGRRSASHRQTLAQFVKYCVVGASSTLIDFGVFLLLMEGLDLHRFVGSVAVARPIAASLSFLVAVTNGFFWNNRWTFNQSGRAGAHGRYARFVTTNVIGLGLNLLVTTAVAHLLPRSVVALLGSSLNDPAGLIGKMAATCVVVFWNFTASKYWTFRS